MLGVERSRNLPLWAVQLQSIRPIASRFEVDRCLSYLTRNHNVIRQPYYDAELIDFPTDRPRSMQIINSFNTGGMDEWTRGRSERRVRRISRDRSMPPVRRAGLDHWEYRYAPPAQILEDWSNEVDQRLEYLERERADSMTPISRRLID